MMEVETNTMFKMLLKSLINNRHLMITTTAILDDGDNDKMMVDKVNSKDI